jgi:hypothetical protein
VRGGHQGDAQVLDVGALLPNDDMSEVLDANALLLDDDDNDVRWHGTISPIFLFFQKDIGDARKLRLS